MLDGIDMSGEMKFSEKFMSHKFKQSNGLKYKVGVCITTG